MKKYLFTIAATIMTMVAALVASSACIWLAYQPNEPICLRDE